MKKVLLLLCLSFHTIFVNAQWELLNPGTVGKTLRSVFFTSSFYGYAVGDTGTVLKTVDGGVTWDSTSYGSKYYLNSLFFTDSISGIVVGGYDSIVYNGHNWESDAFKIILKTNDGGATWNKVSGVSLGALRSVYFTDSNTGYAVGDKGSLLKTINSGQTWDSIPTGTTITIRSVYFPDPDTGYAAGGDGDVFSRVGYIWKSKDGGNTWSDLDWMFTIVFNSVFFPDAQKGCAVGGVFRQIVRTADGGKNWNEVSSWENGQLNSVFFTSPSIGYAVGNGGSILTTNNGGIDWTYMESGTSNDLYSVYFPSPSIGYAVGTGGTILKNNHGAGSIEEKESNSSIYEIYPNPADTKITIFDKTKMPRETEITICSVSGNILMRTKFNDLNQVELDVSTLATGFYLMKIQTKVGIEVKKLVIE